jgi:chromosome segregation ATPase
LRIEDLTEELDSLTTQQAVNVQDVLRIAKELAELVGQVASLKVHVENLESSARALTVRMDKSDDLHDDHKRVLEEVHNVLIEMKELLKTWNSVKSTISVTKLVGETLMWLTKAAAAIVMIGAALKYYVSQT